MERQLLLLGLLRKQDMHGYQLNEFIEEQMHFCTDLKKSTAYYLLDKLAQQGYVAMEEEQEGNRPPRRVYHITKTGEEYFFQLLRENLAGFSRLYYPTDSGIAFMDQLPTPEVIDALKEKRTKVQAELEALRQTGGHSGPLQYVLGHNRKLLETEIDWLDSLIQDLKRS
jgi:DNA-binding PadR family transcriptional regulator